MKSRLIQRFENLLADLMNQIKKPRRERRAIQRYRVQEETLPIDQLILTEQVPERRRVNEGFMVIASENGLRAVGYVAGRIAPLSSTCFVEALYIDNHAYLGKGLSIRLLERAVVITGCQNIVPVNVEDRAVDYWQHIRKRPGLRVGEGSDSKGMNETIESEFVLDWKRRYAEVGLTPLPQKQEQD